MSSTTEVDELYELIGGLRKCVASLASTYGDTPAMRRIDNDAERILNGVDRLGHRRRRAGNEAWVTNPASGEMIQIPDTEYHLDFWRDVDHEGIGGQGSACARTSRMRKHR